MGGKGFKRAAKRKKHRAIPPAPAVRKNQPPSSTEEVVEPTPINPSTPQLPPPAPAPLPRRSPRQAPKMTMTTTHHDRLPVTSPISVPWWASNDLTHLKNDLAFGFYVQMGADARLDVIASWSVSVFIFSLS